MAYHIDNQMNITRRSVDGRMVAARPINHLHRNLLERIKDAYLVFTGKADAVFYEE